MIDKNKSMPCLLAQKVNLRAQLLSTKLFFLPLIFQIKLPLSMLPIGKSPWIILRHYTRPLDRGKNVRGHKLYGQTQDRAQACAA